MRTSAILAFLLLFCAQAFAQAPWHNQLYIPGDGYWHQRIAVTVQNAGDRDIAGEAVQVPIGPAASQAQLVGAQAQAVRVCDDQGIELLYGITDATGSAVTQGTIPAGAKLVLPATVKAGKSAQFYVYFDNPSAWAVPDFLAGAKGLVNGGVEKGADGTPEGWVHDPGDNQHRAAWSDEAPHSGKHCLKTQVSPGAKISWISTRQREIPIVGGARYLLRGWVRARDTKGAVGWYIHMGNATEPMIIGPVFSAGEGTYGWKQISQEIIAPKDATIAEIGTALYGTGTGWFDDVELTCLTPTVSKVSATASAPERLTLTESGSDARPAAAGNMEVRIPLRITNVSSDSISKAMAVVDLRGALGSAGIAAGEMLVADGAKVVPHGRLGDQLFFEASIPAKTIHTYSLYVHTGQPVKARSDIQAYQALLDSPANLVRDPSFELQPSSAAWKGSEGREPAGVQMTTIEGGLFGKRCSRLTVADTVKPGWFGRRQNVPVQPGRRYFVAAWVKSGALASGEAKVNVHFRDAAEELVQGNAMGSSARSITPNSDWTLLTGMYTMPPDAAILQVHLTLYNAGELQHDGVLVAEMIDAKAGMAQRVGAQTPPVSVWPVNPIVKVFRGFLPPAASDNRPANISACRGETEPLQLAIRTSQASAHVRVSVDAPANAAGRRLGDSQISIVGNVPVDHPSNYYQSAVPVWQRRCPTTEGACDGWEGYWPDPLRPADQFSADANLTSAVWINFRIPRDAAPGDYHGKVTFKGDTATIAEVPVTVHVWNFEIPEAASLKAIFDTRMDGRWQIPGQDETTATRDFWKFMADHRASPDRIQPEPVLDYRDGKVVADFTEYDKAAEVYFNQLKLPHSYTPWMFYMFGWGFPPDKRFGEVPYPGEYPYASADRSQLRPEFKKAYQACLKAYWDHVKSRGWADRITLYISDEPFDQEAPIRAQMKALCQMIHEVDPAIRIYSSTWHPQPDWNGSLNVWGAGQYGVFPVDVMKQRQAVGDTIWFTVDGQMCLDTPYCACERLLPWYCFRYGVKAYEFWGVNWLTYDPWQFGWHRFIHQTDAPGKSYYTRYPNGDGYLVYPGAQIGADGPVSSVRMEQVRDGMEDYEYLVLLDRLITKARQAGTDVSSAQAALDNARNLALIPNAGGKLSTAILPDPDALQKARTAVAQAIESLGGR